MSENSTYKLMQVLRVDKKNGKSFTEEGNEISNSDNNTVEKRVAIIVYQMAVWMVDCEHRSPESGDLDPTKSKTNMDDRFVSNLASPNRMYFSPNILEFTMQALLYQLNDAYMNEYAEENPRRSLTIDKLKNMDDIVNLAAYCRNLTEELVEAASNNDIAQLTVLKNQGASVEGKFEKMVKVASKKGLFLVFDWLEKNRFFPKGSFLTYKQLEMVQANAIDNGHVMLLDYILKRYYKDHNILPKWLSMLERAGDKDQSQIIDYVLKNMENDSLVVSERKQDYRYGNNNHEYIQLLTDWITGNHTNSLVQVVKAWSPIEAFFAANGRRILIADERYTRQWNHKTLLDLCILHDQPYTLQVLLQWGANVINVDDLNRSLQTLMAAVARPLSVTKLYAIHLLLRYGADRSLVVDPLILLDLEKYNIDTVFQTLDTLFPDEHDAYTAARDWSNPLCVLQKIVGRQTGVLICEEEKQRLLPPPRPPAPQL